MPCYGRPNPAGLEKMGMSWKKEEIDILLNEIKDKKGYQEIADSHKRTVGSITARLRAIAADLHVDENKTVQECIEITGLDKQDIIDAINRREYNDRAKKHAAEIKAQVKSLPTKLADPVNELRKDINELKKDIKEILRLMNALYDFEASQN
jgi:hypothetical protein